MSCGGGVAMTCPVLSIADSNTNSALHPKTTIAEGSHSASAWPVKRLSVTVGEEMEDMSTMNLHSRHHWESTEPADPEDCHLLLLFHIGSTNTMMRQLRTIKMDYTSLEETLKGSGS